MNRGWVITRGKAPSPNKEKNAMGLWSLYKLRDIRLFKLFVYTITDLLMTNLFIICAKCSICGRETHLGGVAGSATHLNEQLVLDCKNGEGR